MYEPRPCWAPVELCWSVVLFVCRTFAWCGVTTRPTTGADVCRDCARPITGICHPHAYMLTVRHDTSLNCWPFTQYSNISQKFKHSNLKITTGNIINFTWLPKTYRKKSVDHCTAPQTNSNNKVKYVLKSYHSDGVIADDAITTMLSYDSTRSMAAGWSNRCKRNTTELTWRHTGIQSYTTTWNKYIVSTISI